LDQLSQDSTFPHQKNKKERKRMEELVVTFFLGYQCLSKSHQTEATQRHNHEDEEEVLHVGSVVKN
jgi:hypothetical protein